jgi:hypothetical protein
MEALSARVHQAMSDLFYAHATLPAQQPAPADGSTKSSTDGNTDSGAGGNTGSVILNEVKDPYTTQK